MEEEHQPMRIRRRNRIGPYRESEEVHSVRWAAHQIRRVKVPLALG